MKKVTGVGVQVTGIGFRVPAFAGMTENGIGFWGRVVGMILLLTGFTVPGVAQELKYKFRQGQVIQYQYRAESNSYYQRTIHNYVYEFVVDSTNPTGAFMTLIPKSHTINRILDPESKTPRYSQESDLDKINFIDMPFWYADINKKIRFHLSDIGEISRFGNSPSLLVNIIADIERGNSIPSKSDVNYNWLTLRYSDEYYKILIRQFFPPLPGKDRPGCQTLDLVYKNMPVSFGFCWLKPYPDSLSGKYRFANPNTVNVEFKTQGPAPVIGHWRINADCFGTAHWNQELALLDTIKFQSINMPLMLFDLISNMLIATPNNTNFISLTQEKVSIELRKGSFDKLVSVNFYTVSGDSMQMDMLSPGEFIESDRWVTTIPQATQDTFQSQYKMPLNQQGLFNLYCFKMGRIPNEESFNTDKVMFYAGPGDTINIRINLNQPDSVMFSGNHALENNFLKSLFKVDKYLLKPTYKGWINNALNGIRNDRKLFNSRKLEMDPKFVERLDFELTYREKEYELRRLLENPPIQGNEDLRIPLRHYRQFLGQVKYPESAAYRSFLYQFVEISQINAGLFDNSDPNLFYLAASVFLTGWDRYRVLASLAHDALKYRRELNYEANYLAFIKEYPGTPFADELKTLYQNAKITEDPGLTAKLDIAQFLGHPVIVSFDYEKTRIFYKLFVRFTKRLGKSDFRIVQYAPKGDLEKVLNEINLYAILSWDKSEETGSVIHPRVIPDSLLELQRNLRQNLLLFDRDGRFVRYLLPNKNIELQLSNILSWPQLISVPAKTVSLRVFWYSLGGAAFLAMIIVLVPRLRSRRKEKRLNLKRKMAQLEVDAVRSRMNPHFLFNALSSIQNLINKKQIEEANLFLARFGDLVRTILTQSSKPAIGLNEEIDMIRNYLQLEQLRFPFSFDILIDPAIDTFAIEVPPLLIQPHVENAVMHGISSLGANGKIVVSFIIEDNHLICKVTDNGPGYHPGTKTGNGGLGQGWKLTRQRIQLMKEQFGDDVSVEVQPLPDETGDNKESSGTTVIFKLPMQKPD
ncbi:MAG: histidine kinase [Bacteroidales bacterium]|jgi:signal transduction histidine kinase